MNIKIHNVIKYILLLYFSINSQYLEAQQEPQYTQYVFNTLSVNPAYAGTRDAMNALLLSRIQWVGIEGAPRSFDFTMHTPFNKYKMGLGASIVSDSYGPVDNYYINFNYAYRVNLNENLILSMGIRGGIYNYYVGLKSLNIEQIDPTFVNNVNKIIRPNAGLGFFLYAKDFYAGLSIPRLFETDLNNSSSSSDKSQQTRHYFLMGAYIWEINNDFKLKPSGLCKIVQGSPISLDITVQTLYKDRYWFGINYRIGDALGVLINVQINNQITIGYSYDFSISGLRTFNNGTHEILLSYDFNRFMKKKMKSPRYF
ncbi:MAG: type IX secretion system membrane protein PorP/SprF [Bacteroidales bacterium]|nr:type IX secretion system membrane protein PorP/SprF [Bacteroidales bacterium]